MPKKKPGLTPEEQSQAFCDAVQKMVDAGELNPTEAAERLDRIVKSNRKPNS